MTPIFWSSDAKAIIVAPIAALIIGPIIGINTNIIFHLLYQFFKFCADNCNYNYMMLNSLNIAVLLPKTPYNLNTFGLFKKLFNLGRFLF
jgi:hypothetical protein